MADNLPPSSADVTESGSLNLPEASGPHRAVMGMIYLYPIWQTVKYSSFTVIMNTNLPTLYIIIRKF
jgi:hypothetical protein